MKKTTALWILGVLWLTTASSRAQDEQYRPIIVKVVKYTNRAHEIPQTTVYTPSQDGFFRASVYVEEVLTNIANTGQSEICPLFSFTDDSGVVSTGLSGTVNHLCLYANGGLPNGLASEWLFRARANTPIMFSVPVYASPLVQPFAYSVFVVIERLF